MADTQAQKGTPRRSGARAQAAAAPVEDVTLGAGAAVAVATRPDAEELLGELRHKRGCPARTQGVDGPRIEVIEHKVSGAGLDPERGGSNDGYRALIVRCIECGVQYPE